MMLPILTTNTKLSMFEQLSENLNQLMNDAQISADELARRINLPASTIKKIRSNYNPNPTLTTLLPLAKFFRVTLDQLVGTQPLAQPTTNKLHSSIHHLPILSWKEAITWPANKHQTHATQTSEHSYSANAYALEIEEDMETIAKGTMLLIDPAIKPKHRDFVIVYKKDSETPSLKQLVFDESQIYLKPLISDYKTISLTPKHEILGVVVEYKKYLFSSLIVKA